MLQPDTKEESNSMKFQIASIVAAAVAAVAVLGQLLQQVPNVRWLETQGPSNPSRAKRPRQRNPNHRKTLILRPTEQISARHNRGIKLDAQSGQFCCGLVKP
jgi:hypothetical protein